MSDSSMMDVFVSGLGVLAVIYFLLWGLLYLIYGNTLVSRLWQRLGPGIMVFCFLGVLAGKLGGMGYSDLLTKVVLPLVGLAPHDDKSDYRRPGNSPTHSADPKVDQRRRRRSG